jgi:hypothetical protein
MKLTFHLCAYCKKVFEFSAYRRILINLMARICNRYIINLNLMCHFKITFY